MICVCSVTDVVCWRVFVCMCVRGKERESVCMCLRGKDRVYVCGMWSVYNILVALTTLMVLSSLYTSRKIHAYTYIHTYIHATQNGPLAKRGSPVITISFKVTEGELGPNESVPVEFTIEAVTLGEGDEDDTRPGDLGSAARPGIMEVLVPLDVDGGFAFIPLLFGSL
jgi:hypothetical protein